MTLEPIRTERDYDAALARIDEIFDADPDSPEGRELEVRAVLVEDYERRVHPVEAPDAVAAIRFRMEQMGLSQKDLVGPFGSPSRVSELLSGKRAITFKQARAAHRELRVPAEVLL